jgi:hypothetical protein
MAGKNNQVANNTCSLLQGDQTPSALSDYLALTPNLSTTLQIEGDYPERLAVRDFQKDWEVDHPNYEKITAILRIRRGSS